MFLQKLRVYVWTTCVFVFMLALIVTLRIMHFISPYVTKKMIVKVGQKTTMTENPLFTYEDWGPTFMSQIFLKTASKHMWLSLGQEAFTGGDAPDSPVVTMDGERTSVCKFLKDNRPLVLSFGSCT
ncbi:type I iodothyronine deiodinase [Solea senegalensis]|nr:type I iodothyronine deiodinase [Solea senegalensis]